MWDALTLVFIVLVVTLAGFVQGLVGFGSGLVMVPILVIFIPPRVLVPVVLLHGLVLNWTLTLGSRRHLQIKRTLPILAGGIIGIPTGAALLLFLPQSYLKLMIGIVVVLFGCALLMGASVKVRKEGALSFPLGIASGILNG
ncbi:MAG: sulfite exporter TauE/SafE family protein, partial [Candidatus Thermoplasmatota archaeon]|nr:sulfite exporter TauE/SafE family protein [Candidatus Thermoplasmatota archaeon]